MDSEQGYQIALERIERVKKLNLKKLDLYRLKLTNIPNEINELTELEYLDLSGNRIENFPINILNLKKITTLNLSGNYISSLPNSIKYLNNILSLDISSNKFNNFPVFIANLTKLKKLFLSYNNLRSIPNSIACLSSLDELYLSGNILENIDEPIFKIHNLSYLDISNNNISKIPSNISYLENLSELILSNNNITEGIENVFRVKNLKTLFLSNMKLSKIPSSINKLSNLRYLDLSNNNISQIPEVFSEIQNLSILYLSNNKIFSIPKSFRKLSNLCELYLSKNNIRIFQEFLIDLPNLSILHLFKNPIENIPIEIIEKGIESIRSYYIEINKSSKQVFESKLLIVGEPGAGKTSLQKKIIDINSNLPGKENSTRGIDISDWKYNYKDKEITIHIWDFGGQQILKATHSFFMNRGAVFVLLADSRSDNTDYFDWLYRIETFAGNSPVILVHNEHDDRPKEININQLSQRFPEIEAPLRCNLAKVNIEERGNEFIKIIKKIQYELSKLDVMGQELPRSWVSIRNELEKLVDDGKLFISKDVFLSICEKYEINREKAKFISQYLHDIGSILHFQNDPILEHLIIIQPEWATDAVYQLIEDVKILKNYGRFEFDDLNGIWTETYYQEQYHALIQLMKNFQLCYEIPTQKGIYILPQLLRYQPKEYRWNEKGNLFIEYVYPDYYLPDIMTRFIVNSHDLIEDHDFVWRNGVVLTKDGQRAEIVADENRQRIKVRISGDFKNNLLITILDIFDAIHKNYPKIKVEIKVPCNCEKCVSSAEPTLFDLKFLKTRIKNRRFRVECKKPPYYEVEIQDLIEYLGSYEILETYEENNRLVSSK